MKCKKHVAMKVSKKILNPLEKQIKKSYGKRCRDYNPFCVNCIMWHAYDTLKEGLE